MAHGFSIDEHDFEIFYVFVWGTSLCYYDVKESQFALPPFF